MTAGAADVAVIGGGNAALSAALTAAEAGARVVVLERAPRPFRGGNTRHTRNIRTAHAAADGYVTGAYGADEFFADLMSVSGQTDEAIARLVIEESQQLPRWMREHGVGWQAPLRGTLHLARTNHFFLGGGKAMLNAYYERARGLGIELRFEARVSKLHFEDARLVRLTIEADGAHEEIAPRAVVVAAGGFEANRAWLREYWGEAADGFAIRGTPFNDGSMLRALLDAGAEPVGDPRGAHAIAVDARGPDEDGGIVTRLDTIPFGIVVNAAAQRFYDEGEDLWPKRYATWGRLIAEQPGQVAYSILDARVMGSFIAPLYPPILAATTAHLAGSFGLDPAALGRTIDAYNAATAAQGWDMSRLDGCATRGIVPPKSNWARPLGSGPFAAFPLRPGITFTYLGVRVDRHARVQRTVGGPFENVFAAGEIMAGNVLRRGYLAGFGLTIGTTFGRIAGREAASNARA